MEKLVQMVKILETPNFLENISPPTTKSQTPLSGTTAPNDQELLNLFT